MHSFPRTIRPKAPPIKTQGIKTKLVPFILSSISWDGKGRWIEPFSGSCAVALNAAPAQALIADTNKHIIRFYQGIQTGEITPASTRERLEDEGRRLSEIGEDHYYAIRERFNSSADPLDFLFLSRACFNGVMRFNRKGGFNVPFCRKPERYRPALITKISNQIAWASAIIRRSDFTFVCQDWRTTLSQAQENDFIYLDPPYVGRHADYFNKWSDGDADELASTLLSSEAGYAYSMWAENIYRKNEHLEKWFANQPRALASHFYHVGSTEELRNEMQEALVIKPGFLAARPKAQSEEKSAQLALL